MTKEVIKIFDKEIKFKNTLYSNFIYCCTSLCIVTCGLSLLCTLAPRIERNGQICCCTWPNYIPNNERDQLELLKLILQENLVLIQNNNLSEQDAINQEIIYIKQVLTDTKNKNALHSFEAIDTCITMLDAKIESQLQQTRQTISYSI